MSNAPKMDHAYDGIEEFDNPLPGWWKWLFVASIVYSPFYFIYYHGGGEGRSLSDLHSVALAENSRRQFGEIGDLQPTEEVLAYYMHEPRWVGVGESVYRTHCISCHGREGEGKVGPNLTDEHFKYINTLPDIAKVINEGAGNGAMPQWAGRLHPNEVVLVSAYVASMRGRNIDGRPPEGKQIPAWPEPPGEAP